MERKFILNNRKNSLGFWEFMWPFIFATIAIAGLVYLITSFV